MTARDEFRRALANDAVAHLNRIRTSKDLFLLVITNRLQQSILAFRGLEEAANLLQGHHQQQLHPTLLLYSPSAHAIRLEVAH